MTSRNRIPINLKAGAQHRFYAAAKSDDHDGGYRGVVNPKTNLMIWNHDAAELNANDTMLRTAGATHIVEVHALASWATDEYERLWSAYRLPAVKMGAYPDAGSW